MKITLYAIGAAALLITTAVQAADSVPGSVGTAPAAPIQSFGASPGMPGAGTSQQGFGAQPGAPGSPSYQPNARFAFARQSRLGGCARTRDLGFRLQHAEFEQRTRYGQRVARIHRHVRHGQRKLIVIRCIMVCKGPGLPPGPLLHRASIAT